DLFWKSWDREVALIDALNAAGIAASIIPLPGGGLQLTIANQPLEDLSILIGAPIRVLTISGTLVTDLRPLENIPVEELDIRETRISDLSPLRSPILGGALKSLYCWRTTVQDFSPLASCPNLVMLDAAETALTDLSV